MRTSPSSVDQTDLAQRLSLRQVERVLTVVNRTMRREFPSDFDSRCAYAAFAIRALLNEMGYKAQVVGGDFVAFVVSTDGQRAGLQGFGFGQDQCAHYWVETEEVIIDLGPHYLPRKSSYPAERMPAVAWNRREPLPAFLRYQSLVAFSPDAQFSPVQAHRERCSRLIDACQTRNHSQITTPTFTSWIVADTHSVMAASRRDKWAQNALLFAKRCSVSTLPF
jgi:hypothetical protein